MPVNTDGRGGGMRPHAPLRPSLATLPVTGVEPPLARRPIVLIGFMGVGKSAVGKRLARLLGYEFVDTDLMVEQAAGKTIAAIFADEGEERFREMETAALREALEQPARVVSAGGGITTREENRRILAGSAAVVLLTARPEVVLLRVRPIEKRPMLAGWPDPLERIRSLMQERAPIYSEYHCRFDTSHCPPRVTAEKIARWYASLHTEESDARR